MQVGDVWSGDSAAARLARASLTPASWLYAAGWQAYLGIYRFGLKKAHEPHKPVICVGNLTVGGSGKTPVTMHVADVLVSLGFKVVVGCSGYGAPHAEAATLAPEGPLLASEWGDEPALYRWLRPEIPLVVGRRRVLAAELVHRERPDALLLMDDGFQHMPVRKHITILLDPPDPANARCLPAGPYREPRMNRNRADLVIPGAFRIVAQPMRLVRPDGSEPGANRCAILCALGRPDIFLMAFATAFPNLEVVSTTALPDHDPLNAGTLLASLPVDMPIVVTGKDWVKLRERPDHASRDFLIATHNVSIEDDGAFRDWLRDKLNG